MFNCLKVAALVLLVGCLVSIPASAQGKGNNCQDLRLLLQADLNFAPKPDFPPFALYWTGIVKGFLGTAPVNGILYYMPPDDPNNPPSGTIANGQSGHEAGGRMVIDFGGDKFVSEVGSDVFQISPQIAPHMVYPPDFAWGHLSSTVKIDPNYDLYDFSPSGATGNITMSGLFLVNKIPDFTDIPNGVMNLGIWNAEINGKICR